MCNKLFFSHANDLIEKTRFRGASDPKSTFRVVDEMGSFKNDVTHFRTIFWPTLQSLDPHTFMN